MNDRRRLTLFSLIIVTGLMAHVSGQQRQSSGQEGFRFRSGVELVNVTATVTDSRGRFVSGLKRQDFAIFEDGRPQEVTHFSNERVPVSLGLLIDTSGSMAGEKWTAAKGALDRFLIELMGPEDEVFVYRFNDAPILVSGWTRDRRSASRALDRIRPFGGTAMYDTLAEGVPLAQSGTQRKKAIVLISDGNDRDSHTDIRDVRELIRETEVLVYAVGIDGVQEVTFGAPVRRPPPRIPIPLPFPIPGGRTRFPPGYPPPSYPPPSNPQPGARGSGTTKDSRVNENALREITDESGGRTEIVRSAQDIDPATASIADELNQQYYLGYPSPAHRDGRWHAIRVEVRDRNLQVRSRRGYIAPR